MPPDRWDRVQSVFLSLADLPPGERAVLLDQECGGDGELRAEVESLLASDGESAQIISAAIAKEAALWVDVADLAGSRLGSWRIIREIGRGGMGTVYRAVRDDDQFQKQVAIKVVRHGMDTADVLERFRHERQILANLDHPYIARLLDGGTTPDGRPFFVMDYVEGKPLDVFWKENKLAVEARCRLFLRILEAVSHAHRNLVVHRDLKPANIFVTSDGSPKLLDFGVAKLLATAPGAGPTLTALNRPFTPEYASPEQVHGSPVTTAVDIYSLGAVLYEMLTGRRAQTIDSLSPSEIERVVCHTEVTRPSLLATGLDADLDNIVLMAMRKEPARRYQSVDQFADDIHRYLSGRAVLARQDSFWYRARKFAGRNRLQISGAALIFVSLVAALVVTLAQTRVAQSARRTAEEQRGISDRERARAEQERTRAEAGFRQAELARADEAQQRRHAEQGLTQLLNIADKTLFDIHDVVARLPGATEARQLMVKTTLDYLERIQNDNGLDDRLRLALGAGYSRIAAIQGDPLNPSLGDVRGARDSYLKAKALLAPLYARSGNDPDVIMHWLEVETGLAALSYSQSRSDQTIQMYAKLLPVAHRLAQLAPSSLPAAKQEAKIQGALTMALHPTDARAALDHADRQIAILTALTGRFPGDRDLKRDLANSLDDAAVPLTDLGNYAQAAEYFERSIGIREPLLEIEPANVQTKRGLLMADANYCALLGIPWSPNMGRPAEARTYCGKASALARALSAADPQDQTARFDLGYNLGQLGMLDPDPDKVADSLKTLEEALSVLDPIVRANPSAADPVLRVELVRQYAGRRLQRLGRLTEAADSFRRALAELEAMTSAKPGQPKGTAVALGNEEGLAEVYAEQGDRDAALTYARKALDRAQKYDTLTPGRAVSVGHLGEAYFELAWVERTLGAWTQAEADAERATSLWRSIEKDDDVLSVHREARERTEALVREIAAHRAQ
jgi:tetratricopeptide (TPR) repeat protein/tRNA A-37 threonylcarbamoyl transferase component Bud32